MYRVLKFSLFVVVIAALGFKVYNLNGKNSLSDLALANIEALADNSEIGPSPGGNRYTCAYGIRWGGVSFIRDREAGCVWQYFVSSYRGTSQCYK